MSDFTSYLSDQREIAFGFLPPQTRRTIDALETSGQSYDRIVQEWLEPAGPLQISPYGTMSRTAFFDAFKKEIYNFVCSNDHYKEERTKMLEELQGITGGAVAIQAFIASSITMAISPVLGVISPLIGPPVALMLYIIAKMSKSAWCAAHSPI